MSPLEPNSQPQRSQTITAIFDGQVLRPETPLDLETTARYRITITPVAEDNQDSTGGNLWDLLDRLAGTVEMPPDWSAEHDHYLYGTPRRQHGPDTESSATLQMEASRLFERAMAWLQDNYGRYRFFAERDIVWTVQTYISKVIAEQGLPLRIFNDHRMLPGKRADLAIVDSRKVVLVAVEVKYEPSHKRSGDDISPLKFPVVFWTGDGSVAKDVERVREFVEMGLAKAAYSVFIDEGRYLRHRLPPQGSEWEDWEPGGVSVLCSRVKALMGGSAGSPLLPPPDGEH